MRDQIAKVINNFALLGIKETNDYLIYIILTNQSTLTRNENVNSELKEDTFNKFTFAFCHLLEGMKSVRRRKQTMGGSGNMWQLL